MIGKNSRQKDDKKKADKVEKYGDDFVPPDGGWGWMIVLATGFSNFCILPVLQSFGLLFKDKFEQLGISSSETTTIINMNCAVTACIGLANGPLFRRFSYRQVSLTGALICAVSVTILSTMRTFTGVLLLLSVLYGIGTGITLSSNALALNIYFKEKRRIATGLSWTCTGVGPIVIPQIITLLMPEFGMEGTVLIFGGFAFNAVVCALLLQPVSWHTKDKKVVKRFDGAGEKVYQELAVEKTSIENGKEAQSSIANGYQSRSLENVGEPTKSSYGVLGRSTQKFGSQYLYYDDEEDGATGIDVIGPVTPMMSRANDGWFSKWNTSNASLNSRSSRKDNSQRTLSRRPSVSLSRQSSLMALSKGSSVRNLNRQNSDVEGRRRKVSSLQASAAPLIILSESCEHTDLDECKDGTCNHKPQPTADEKIQASERLIEMPTLDETTEDNQDAAQEKWYKRFLKATVIFFDLDLLRDPIYVNLMLGITFANFAEVNFSLMTPFILGEYGFSKHEIALVMSILAGVDVAARITIPFVATFIGWENRTFFLVGVCSMATGRIVLAHIQDFGVTVAIAVLIGAGKALRTIFMALVIPTHVPLSRLPAATGLQLVVSGLVSLVLGPFVGLIRDVSQNYAMMLHILNILTYLTAISWIAENFIRKRRARKLEAKEQVANA